ncbi:DnaJ C-terminal domain-containing protein [Paraburkholderia fungorum]|uniref:DnaJ C-terminal domain-containing protein n=1 Tax=Paraburkholderia fungorum TaxID=134537 RepID=UPI0038BDE5C4
MRLDEYYKRLGLPSTASSAEVKRAYRRLRATYHPDRNKGRESKVEPVFKRVQEAFEILTGEREPPLDTRTPANDSGRNAKPPQQESSSRQADHSAWSASRRWDAYGSKDRPPMRGANRHHQLHVPLEVALNGGDVPARYESTGICRQCHGASAKYIVKQCSDCGGVGQLADGKRCGGCAGTGRTGSSQWCPTCQSKGIENFWKSDTVKVPPGAWDGQRLVVAGGGHPGPNGGPAGDAIFSVVVVCGSDFHREGLNLTGEIHVDFVTATLGGTFEARILGRELRMTIPPNSQHGSNIRLPALGLSDGAGKQGDLRLHIVLAMHPAAMRLTNEQRQLFQEMFADAARRTASDT